jgi:coenzyme F420-reducing hydrogenase alpha subunit
LNFAQLPVVAREAASECKVTPPCRNPYQSIVVRAIETVFACEEALELIARYEPPETASVPAPDRAGAGQSVTEAPRGTLYHQYKIDNHGLILEAQIVPPTAQNQKRMEDDLWQLATRFASLPMEALRDRCARALRNYDPCISCATHCVVIDRAG